MENRNRVISFELYKIRKGGIPAAISEIARIRSTESNPEIKNGETSNEAPLHFGYFKRKMLEKRCN